MKLKLMKCHFPLQMKYPQRWRHASLIVLFSFFVNHASLIVYDKRGVEIPPREAHKKLKKERKYEADKLQYLGLGFFMVTSFVHVPSLGLCHVTVLRLHEVGWFLHNLLWLDELACQ